MIFFADQVLLDENIIKKMKHKWLRELEDRWAGNHLFKEHYIIIAFLFILSKLRHGRLMIAIYVQENVSGKSDHAQVTILRPMAMLLWHCYALAKSI